MTTPLDPRLNDEGGPVWPGLWSGILLVLTAIAIFAVPIWLIQTAPPAIRAAAKIVKPSRVAPKTVVPEVEPVALQPVTRPEAVAFNDTVPFSTAPNPAARPFRFGGTPLDRERAVTCLAAAMLYEAGNDVEGQQSVAQVVLNRARHPAFPSSICGVVFQGSERRTGCQFTFTCDGALRRRYSDDQWTRARKVASDAIDGAVFAAVGQATHYHTNWVVPYWSSSLDKIVEIKTHLFFRWTGWWGTPAAFSKAASGTEPNIPQLAAYSAAHGGSTMAALDAMGTVSASDLPPDALPVAIAADTNTFITALDGRMAPSEFPALAKRVCGERPYCKFLAWRDPALVPKVSLTNLPADSPALQTMAFSYLRDRGRQFEKALWNCSDYPRDNPLECMRRRIQVPATTPASAPAPAPVIRAPVEPPPVLQTRPRLPELKGPTAPVPASPDPVVESH